MGVSPSAFRCQGNAATPCQYIDTTRKAIDCATADNSIWWNFTADFSSFIVETCMKDDKFRYLIPILRKLGAACAVVLTQYRRVTDGRTDRRTDGQTNRLTDGIAIASRAQCAVKTHLPHQEVIPLRFPRLTHWTLRWVDLQLTCYIVLCTFVVMNLCTISCSCAMIVGQYIM